MDARRQAIQHLLRPHDLRGADLRFALLTLLHRAGAERSIAQLLAELTRLGLTVGGENPAKTVSDVLRCEVGKGRVLRVRRGLYRSVPRPDTTTRRHRDRLIDLANKASLPIDQLE